MVVLTGSVTACVGSLAVSWLIGVDTGAETSWAEDSMRTSDVPVSRDLWAPKALLLVSW